MTSKQRREFIQRMTWAFGAISATGCGGGSASGTPVPSGADLTPSPTPAAPVPAPVASPSPAPAAVGARQFTLVSPLAGSAPFTVGFAFRKGDIPAGQNVVSNVTDLQVTPKNRWNDGSLKFAIVAGRTTLSAGVPATVSLSPGSAPDRPALTLGELKATGVTAAISAGQFGSAQWSAADWDQPFVAWVAGPEMSSWIYRKPIGSDAHLVAWLEVRIFKGNAVEVLPWIENGYLMVPGPTSKAERFTFALGGTQRFSADIDLPNHCRTPLVAGGALSYWLGADPQITPKHDTEYLQSTALVPSYRAKVAPEAARVKALVTTYSPLQQGNLPPGMGAGGYHASIGLLPEWDVLYLTSTSSAAYASIVCNGYSMGRYGIHFRDEKTNRPLRFSSYPNLLLGAGSNVSNNGASTKDLYTPTSTGTRPQTWAFTHHPSTGFLPYLVTGRWYFMEELQFAATLHFLKTTDWIRNFTEGVMETQANTTRGIAWTVRTLAQAACITPDDDLPLRTEFLSSLQSNIDWNYARYIAQPNNAFGWVEPYSDYSGAGDGLYFEATWMQDFVTAAFGYTKAMEPAISAASASRLDAFFAWKARSIIGRLGGGGADEYLFCDAAPYSIAVAASDSADWVKGQGPWLADWGATYAATMKQPNPGSGDQLRGGFFPDATSYWGNLQPAIAYAVQHGLPGALAAYRRLTTASNWSALATNFNADPVWSVRPSTGE